MATTPTKDVRGGADAAGTSFLSPTLHNEQHFFAWNQPNRISLRTKNKGLKENADGTLTIYVQDKPGAEKDGAAEVHWAQSLHKAKSCRAIL
ncbi:DUF1214 domain-containing protein [Phyllobacterium sp. SYP-B3895]|uniref:DUF1214 domain-containing protein n=1 Tax=Phyllobacterium sp. SYP-B3895 TaxID=2663240 RepID=UPI001AEFAD05|nr:DUF1214 domain-containing protein [Phyllobacterium sp. SYP-B3895]